MGFGDILLIIAWAIGVVVALWLLWWIIKNSFFVVEQGTVIVVKRFGRHHRVLGPGLHGRIPIADNEHRTFSNQRQSLPLELRGDSGGRLPVQLAVELEIMGLTDPELVARLAYEIQNPERHLTVVATAAVRQLLLPMSFEDVVGDKNLATKLQEALEGVARECGFVIMNIRVTSILPEPSVHKAIVDGARAKEERATAAANAAQQNRLRVESATATAGASAIEATAGRKQLEELTAGVLAAVEKMRSANVNDKDIGTLIAALLFNQTATTVATAGGHINLLPPGIELGDRVAALLQSMNSTSPAKAEQPAG